MIEDGRLNLLQHLKKKSLNTTTCKTAFLYCLYCLHTRKTYLRLYTEKEPDGSCHCSMTALIKVIHRTSPYLCVSCISHLCLGVLCTECGRHMFRTPQHGFPCPNIASCKFEQLPWQHCWSYSRLHTSYPGSFWTSCSFLISSVWSC